MVDLDKTEELIPLTLLQSILLDSKTYEDFIHRRNNFKGKDLTNYVKLLNDFMDLYSARSFSVDEEIYDRINKINKKFGGNRRFEYMTYLLRTQPLVTIDDIECILTDDSIFDKFMHFYENQDFFSVDLIGYLSVIDEYVGYFKSNGTHLDNKIISRFNRIKLKYALEYKKRVYVAGKEINVSIAPELEEEILASVNLDASKFTLARELYIELNKRCSYDLRFAFLDQNLSNEKAKEIYDGSKLDKSNGKYRAVCNTWAMIYAYLLKTCGIDAKVIKKNGGIHAWVEFDCDGTYMKADATTLLRGEEGLYLDDLTRCQLGLDTAGFVCLEENKDISYVLEEADEEIGYKRKTKSALLEVYKNEYRNLYLNNSISIEDKLNFLVDIATSSNLINLELFKYLNIIFENLFTEEELAIMGRSYVATKNGEAGFVISHKNESGGFEFFVLSKMYSKKYTANQLNRLLDKGMIKVVGKKKEIYGLERTMEDGNDRQFKK